MFLSPVSAINRAEISLMRGSSAEIARGVKARITAARRVECRGGSLKTSQSGARPPGGTTRELKVSGSPMAARTLAKSKSSQDPVLGSQKTGAAARICAYHG